MKATFHPEMFDNSSLFDPTLDFRESYIVRRMSSLPPKAKQWKTETGLRTTTWLFCWASKKGAGTLGVALKKEEASALGRGFSYVRHCIYRTDFFLECLFFRNPANHLAKNILTSAPNRKMYMQVYSQSMAQTMVVKEP